VPDICQYVTGLIYWDIERVRWLNVKMLPWINVGEMGVTWQEPCPAHAGVYLNRFVARADRHRESAWALWDGEPRVPGLGSLTCEMYTWGHRGSNKPRSPENENPFSTWTGLPVRRQERKPPIKQLGHGGTCHAAHAWRQWILIACITHSHMIYNPFWATLTAIRLALDARHNNLMKNTVKIWSS